MENISDLIETIAKNFPPSVDQIKQILNNLSNDENKILNYASYLSPGTIKVDLLKFFFDFEINDCLDKLKRTGLLDVYEEKNELKIETLTQIEIKQHQINNQKETIESIIQVLNKNIQNEEFLMNYYQMIDYFIDQVIKLDYLEKNKKFILLIQKQANFHLFNSKLIQESFKLNQHIYVIKKRFNNFDDEYIRCLNSLALCYSNLNEKEKCLELSEELLKISSDLSKEKINEPLLAELYNNLGLIYLNKSIDSGSLGFKLKLNNLELSKEYLTKSIEIQKTQSDNNISLLISSLSGLKMASKRLGESGKLLLDLDLEIYELSKKLYQNKNNLCVLQSLQNLAECYSNLRNYEKELEFNLEAYELLNCLVEYKTHNEVASSLEKIADSYSNFKNYQKALEYYFKSYELLHCLYHGANHPDLSESLKKIALCYQNSDDNRKALEYNLKAYEMYKNYFNQIENHTIVDYLRNTGESYFKLNDYANSIEYFSKANEILEKICQNYQVMTKGEILNSLAICYEKIKDFKKAIELKLKAHEVYKCLSEDSIYVSNILYELAVLYEKCGDRKTSLDYITKAGEVLQSLIEEDSDSEDDLTEDELDDLKNKITLFEKKFLEDN